MSLITLLDIVKRNGRDMEVGLVDETTKAHPEISGRIVLPGGEVRQLAGVGAARTIIGTSYKTLVRTALPSVSFRDGNQGTARTKSRYEERTVETYIMNPRWGVDKAVADRSEDGWQALMADEAEAHTEAAWQTVGKQLFYGRGTGDSKGHPGLVDAYDSTNKVVDAGGTTADTGSSVWFVKWGPRAVQWVYGQNGKFEASDVDLRDLTDTDGNNYTGYHQELYAYPGVQVSSNRYLVRIRDITEDSGKGLTDALIASALSKFDSGVVPDVMFMSRRSLFQLQASRTATNATGTPAPIPQEAFGVPIAPTDSILDTEALS